MSSKTNEKTFEQRIEFYLTGKNTEGQVFDEDGASRDQGSLYDIGSSKDFDPKHALDKVKLWEFLKKSQSTELKKLQDRTASFKEEVEEYIDKRIKKYGVLDVLKKGVKLYDATLSLFYSAPYNDINQDIERDFKKNIFSITRQVYYEREGNNSIDMVIFVNGLPVVTMELKNNWSGQNYYNAIKQYKEDRDPVEPLLNFKRCLVHFALDTEEIYMTTQLNGKKTFFLPFNKGNNFGKGNPVNLNGYKTSYLWEEILTKKSLANIIQHFAKYVEEKDKKGKVKSKSLYFPRYHQLNVVRKLLSDAKINGPGETYLIQHSAGSGKSNSITWLAYQLVELYNKENRPVFDTTIVVTDRTVLDKQIRDNVKLFSEVKNIVAHAESSADLKKSLESGKKIIITTIQKFPWIIKEITDISNRSFAVIIDEAHSSQSGKAADNLTSTLESNNEEEYEDIQDKIVKVMEARKLGKNSSYFAFTATPKNSTLEKFGVRNKEGKFDPFDLYSMKQAIEEGFILDVLSNYTTYRSYYELEKSVVENPEFDTSKAQKKLKAYVEGHKENIKNKADIITCHFLESVVQTKKLKGKAKAMVVTKNIEMAIRYYQEIKRLLESRNANFKSIIAFSGKKEVDGVEYSEDTLNKFPSKDIKEKFDSDEYKILVVANKFLTGFDQPKLSTMYIDKKLQGVLCVQALSRLNRSNNKLNKRSEDLFVLDFFNTIDEIKVAFDPFYTSTSLSEATDPNVLHELQDNLNDEGVYESSEIEQFNEMYFSNKSSEELKPIIGIAANRFNMELGLSDDDKADFKIKAKQFVKIYSQISAIIPFDRIEWEKLYWFLKFLIPDLIINRSEDRELDNLLSSVDLKTYALERVRVNHHIGLDDSAADVDPLNPNPRGAHGGDEVRDPLEEIVRTFNERWFEGWDVTPEEKRAQFVNLAQKVMSDPNFKDQYENNEDVQNKNIALENLIDDAFYKDRAQQIDLYKLYAGDQDFKKSFINAISHMIAKNLLKK